RTHPRTIPMAVLNEGSTPKGIQRPCVKPGSDRFRSAPKVPCGRFEVERVTTGRWASKGVPSVTRPHAARIGGAKSVTEDDLIAGAHAYRQAGAGGPPVGGRHIEDPTWMSTA